MSSVRRSARLSTTRPMTQMQRAQPDVDAALNEIFNLNNIEVEAMDNALIGIIGEGVDDLQDVIVHEPG